MSTEPEKCSFCERDADTAYTVRVGATAYAALCVEHGSAYLYRCGLVLGSLERPIERVFVASLIRS